MREGSFFIFRGWSARLALILSLLVSGSVYGITFQVSDAREFQAALATAASTDSEDQILLGPGQYLGPFQVAFDNRKTLKISSKNTGEEVSLSGESEIFILSLDGGEHEVNVILEDIQFHNGYNPSFGGAISFFSQSETSSLRIKNSSFLNNTAKRGGAIYSQAADVVVQNSTFVGNKVTGTTGLYSGGAAIYVDKGALSVVQSSFENNDSTLSDFGGVIHSGVGLDTSFSLDNCSFFGNTGVLLSSVRSGSLSVINSTVAHQSFSILAAKDAQTILLRSNEFHCADCSEMLSHRQRFGNHPSVEIEISKNLLRGSGNIIMEFSVDYLKGPKITIVGNEISFVNSSVEASEIELVGYDSLDFVNNTVLEGLVRLSPKFDGNQYTSLVNNIFSNSGGVTNQVSLEAFTRSDEISHNLIQRFSKGWDIQKSNDSSEPIFASIEQLDLKLVLDSPGIDAGDNDVVKDAEATDRDGSPRIVGSVVDIGAYERFTGSLHPADADGNSLISQAEFEAYNSAWRANEVWTTSPTVIPIDFVTRAGYLLQKGGAYKNIGVGKPQTWVPANE